MATYKVTYFIQQSNAASRTAGFSESWYMDNTTQSLAEDAVKATMDRRAWLLPTGGVQIGYRVQDTAPPFTTLAKHNVITSNSGLAQDIPQLARIFILKTAGNQRRAFVLRALPDVRAIGGVYSGAAIFDTSVANFFLDVMKYSLRSINLANLRHDLTGITAGGVFTTIDAHGMNGGDYAMLFRTKDVNGRAIKGKFAVAPNPTSTTGTLLNWGGVAVAKGSIRKITYAYPRIAVYEAGDLTTRKVGRIFQPYIGRQTKGR